MRVGLKRSVNDLITENLQLFLSLIICLNDVVGNNSLVLAFQIYLQAFFYDSELSILEFCVIVLNKSV